MEGQDYLDQISAANRPVKTSKIKNIFSSKFFYLGLAAVVLLIIVILIGNLLSNSKTSPKDLSFALKLHLDNTTEIIKNYQTDIKSSSLRSASASLNSVLSDTNNKLTDYITEAYAFNIKNVNANILDQANLEKDGLESELFQAKINGNLDRVFAHKMSYQISLLANEETKLLTLIDDENYRNILSSSHDSLLNLYDSFNNFSETN